MKEIKVWLRYTINAFQQILVNPAVVAIFMAGKMIRVLMFLVFLGFLFNGASGLGGYTREQIIFFYLSYNLIDTLGQLFFREVYRFRPLVVSGNFDFVLLKPVSPLIRVLLGGADVMDLLMIIVLVLATSIFSSQNFLISGSSVLLFLVLLINGLIISAAFHIFVLGIGIITTSVDHMIMIYRDLASMLRIPVDLYTEPIRSLITFVLPLGIMITFPSKVLIGLLSPDLIVLSLIFGIVSLMLSLKFWNFAVKKYSSASS